MASQINYGIVDPNVLDYAGQTQKNLNVQKTRMDVERLENERKIMFDFQKQLAAKGIDTDLNFVFDTMIKTGNPDYVAKGLEGKAKLQEQINFAKDMGYGMTPPAPAAAPTGGAPTGTPMGMPSAAPAPGAQPVNALVPTAGAQAAPTAPVNALAGQVAPDEVNVIKTQINNLLRRGTQQSLNAAKILQDQLKQLKPETPKTGVVVGAKGTLVNPVTGEVIYRNTSEEAPIGLSKKEIQNREAKFPQATSAVKTFEAKTDELQKDLLALKNHKGLASITGIAAGRMPGLTADGRAAEALYDKITARGGFKELQDMRAASPTGGALGNVSNQEGAQLRAAFAAIDRKQDAADVRKAIDTAIADLQGSKSRVREAYDMTYDYKGGGATKTNTPLTLDQLLEKYK